MLYFFTIICYNFNCRVPAWSAGKSGILVSAALLIFFNFTKPKAALMDGSLVSYYHSLPLSGLQKTCNIIFTFMSIMSTGLIFLAAHYPANQTPRAIIITCYALMRFSVCCAYFYLFIMLSGDLRCMSFCLSAFFFMCR